MALMECPDCGTAVSEKAAACLNCGCPIAPVPGTTVTVTVPTARSGGAYELWGGALMVFGVIIGLMSAGGMGWLAFVIGCGLFLYGRCS